METDLLCRQALELAAAACCNTLCLGKCPEACSCCSWAAHPLLSPFSFPSTLFFCLNNLPQALSKKTATALWWSGKSPGKVFDCVLGEDQQPHWTAQQLQGPLAELLDPFVDAHVEIHPTLRNSLSPFLFSFSQRDVVPTETAQLFAHPLLRITNSPWTFPFLPLYREELFQLWGCSTCHSHPGANPVISYSQRQLKQECFSC